MDIFKPLQFELLCYVFSPIAKTLAIYFEITRGLVRKDREGQDFSTCARLGTVGAALILLEQPESLSCSVII